MSTIFHSAKEISREVRSHERSAVETVKDHIAHIDRHNDAVNAVTQLHQARALEKAAEVDQKIALGMDPGPLAGVPFGVKNLFDVAGEITLAGSKINQNNTPAQADSPLIERLESSGAILLASLAMGEYAYDFTGENQHYGACRNPWDLESMSGGSSSGSGSAAASGMLPFTLGSDTNGSIRVPSSLCGLFGLKPTYGRLPRTGTYPFCDSLDHLGPMARSTVDLALAYDAMQGWDSSDPACARKSQMTTTYGLEAGAESLRIGVLGGYFDTADYPEAHAAVSTVANALNAAETLICEGVDEGRAAAYLITNAEGGTLHAQHLRDRVEDFDVDTRERFLAGTMLPSAWYIRAQAVRRWFQAKMMELFQDADILIAPATPCSAPKLGTKVLNVRGVDQPLRPNLGFFSQPISCIGLPVTTVPVWNSGTSMPIGVQIIASPWREDLCLRVAQALEASGVCQSKVPDQFQPA